MPDLISIDRALAQLPAATDDDTALVANIVSSSSQAIENHLNRQFARGEYDELHTVTGYTSSIWVNNPPIIDVASVRNSELPALYVQCNDATNQVQAATVDVTPTAVVLKRTYNGTTTTSTFLYSAYPTFTALATAINALGNGWVATLSSQFALWTTSDLATNQGNRSARNMSVPLLVFWYGLSGYKVNKPLGEIIVPGLYRGEQVYRVTYTGGFAEVPEPVQQACAELVQMAFASIRANPLMSSETLDKYSYTRAFPANWFDLLSTTARMALVQYKVHRLTVEGINAKA